MQNLHLILLILLFLAQIVHSELGLNLQATDATLYTNNKILLKFKVEGATSTYNVKFKGIPTNWDNYKNDLVISNVTQQSVSNWTFDIVVTELQKRRLTQTIKIALYKYQISVYAITLPQLQNISNTRDNNANGSKNQFNLTKQISKYPGIVKNGFSLIPTSVASTVITPLIIASAQATYIPERDSKPISLFQLKRNAALQRQNNAVKAIANLIFIIGKLNDAIDQLRKILIQQSKYLQQYKDTAFNCSQDKFKIDNTISKIQNAIQDKKIKITQYKSLSDASFKNIDLLKLNLTDLNNQKYQIDRKTVPEGLSLIQLENKITQCQNKIKNNNLQIDNLTANIKANNFDISVAQNNIDNSNMRLIEINSSLGVVRSKILDLKSQLRQAQDQEQNLMKDQMYYISVPIQNKSKIQKLQKANKDFETQSNNLNQQSINLTAICEGNKKQASSKKQSISAKKQKYAQILMKISQNNKNIQGLQLQAGYQLANITNLNSQVFALNNELQKTNFRSMQQKYICSVAQQNKVLQQKKIDDINLSINNNIASLSQASKNLQAARAQKQLADTAVNQIIQSTTSTTLFSITPNGGSTILGGTPLGNNPSGSALGPAFRVDTIEKGSLNINTNNLTNFLSTVYSMNIDPTQIIKILQNQRKVVSPITNQNLTNLSAVLYPMDNQSRNIIAASSSLANQKCQVSSGIQTRSGLIQQVTPGSILVRDSLNQKFTLSISSCTKIASTKPLNFFATGSRLYFSGVQVFNILGNTLYDTYSVLIVPT